MVALAFMIGAMVVLLGLVACTDRVDRWHRRRCAPKQQIGPPFRTSANQCVDCGRDDEPLSIDTHQCFVCFGVAHG